MALLQNSIRPGARRFVRVAHVLLLILSACDSGAGGRDAGGADVCQPACGQRECGADPVCGSPCGTCADGEACGNGVCDSTCPPSVGPEDCPPLCAEPDCAPWTCCETIGCNACAGDEICFEGSCCTPAVCAPGTCGDDGCGGRCLDCVDSDLCQDDHCVPTGGWVRTIDVTPFDDESTAVAWHSAGLVVVGYSQRVVMLDRADGSTLWSNEDEAVPLGSAWLDVASDDSGVYLAGLTGYFAPPRTWVVAKRSGSGETLWSRDVTDGMARHLAVSVDGVYVVGTAPCQDGSAPCERLEKRRLEDGEVLWQIDWLLEPRQTFAEISGVAVDGTGVYLAASSATSSPGSFMPRRQWHVEKRSTADGELLWRESTVVPDASRLGAVLVDSTGVRILCSEGNETGENSDEWRIDRRSLADGSMISGFPLDYPEQYPEAVALHADTLWITGSTRYAWNGHTWFVEQRHGDSGQLLSLRLLNPVPRDEGARALAVDDIGVAIVGALASDESESSESLWRIVYLAR